MKKQLPEKIEYINYEHPETHIAKIIEIQNDLISYLSQLHPEVDNQLTIEKQKVDNSSEQKEPTTPHPDQSGKVNGMNSAEIAILDNLLYFFGQAILDKKHRESNPVNYPKAQDMLDANEKIEKSGQEIIDFISKTRHQALEQFKERLKGKISQLKITTMVGIGLYQDEKEYNKALDEVLSLLTNLE